MVDYLVDGYKLSERRACRVMGLHRSTHRSRRQAKHIAVTNAIYRFSHRYPRFGYRKIHTLTVNEGHCVSRESTRLIRKCEGFQV